MDIVQDQTAGQKNMFLGLLLLKLRVKTRLAVFTSERYGNTHPGKHASKRAPIETHARRIVLSGTKGAVGKVLTLARIRDQGICAHPAASKQASFTV